MSAITREFLEEQIAALQTQQSQAMAQLNAVDGAMKLCQYVLAEFDKPEEIEEEMEDGITET